MYTIKIVIVFCYSQKDFVEALCRKERDLDDMRFSKKDLQRQLEEQREIVNQLQNKMNAVSVFAMGSTVAPLNFPSRVARTSPGRQETDYNRICICIYIRCLDVTVVRQN